VSLAAAEHTIEHVEIAPIMEEFLPGSNFKCDWIALVEIIYPRPSSLT
jgi:hypothetical protein